MAAPCKVSLDLGAMVTVVAVGAIVAMGPLGAMVTMGAVGAVDAMVTMGAVGAMVTVGLLGTIANIEAVVAGGPICSLISTLSVVAAVTPGPSTALWTIAGTAEASRCISVELEQSLNKFRFKLTRLTN